MTFRKHLRKIEEVRRTTINHCLNSRYIPGNRGITTHYNNNIIFQYYNCYYAVSTYIHTALHVRLTFTAAGNARVNAGKVKKKIIIYNNHTSSYKKNK